MKAIIKVIWLYVAVILRGSVMDYITVGKVNALVDKLDEFVPLDLAQYNIIEAMDFFTNLNNVIFMTILFLGLDIINGEMSGILKGPFKLVFNTIVYIIGFTILFYAVGSAIDIKFA